MERTLLRTRLLCALTALALLPAAAAAHADAGPLSDDGIQTWFNDQRAVVHDGKLFTGMVTRDGSIKAAQYDLATGGYLETVLHAGLEVDDHDNPGIEVLPDGRLAYFYAAHSEDELMRFRVSRLPGDISLFGPERHRDPTPGSHPVAYANPIHLSAENRLYLFTRNSRRQPTVTYSGDDGRTWSRGGEIFVGDAQAAHRPYVKYADNGRDRIDFFATWGHPAEVPFETSDLYHFYYDAGDGAFHRTDGTRIRTLASVLAGAPLTPADVTQIYEASGDGNAWTWSIALDAFQRPVVTYAVFKSTGDHRYRYARWDGARWQQHDVVAAGGALYPDEGFYSGGIVLDPKDPSRVFLSRQVAPGNWEIERWSTPDGGASWSSAAVTSGSGTAMNFRPFVPEGRTPGIPEVMWVRGRYTTFMDYATGLFASPAPRRAALPELVTPPAVAGVHASGQSLRALPGAWSGAEGHRLQWTRDGVPIAGATGEAYTVGQADAASLIGLRVTAHNAAGRRTAEAEPVGPSFDPASVAGLRAWFRADDLVVGDGKSVSVWPDASGNGNVLTQLTPGKQPSYAASPIGFGGRPAVRFDSAGDGSGLAGPATDIGRSASGMTVFAVAKAAFQPATPRSLLFVPGATAARARLALQAGAVPGQYQLVGRRADGSPLASIGGGDANADAVQLTGVVNYVRGSATLRAGGREVAAGPFDTPGTSSSTASAGLRLGANGALSGDYWGGHVAEVLVYQRVLTAAEVAKVEGHLRRKYRLETAG